MEELYSKEKSILIRVLGDNPKLRILDFFLDNRFYDFSKQEVINALGMNKQTFYKYFGELVRDGIIVQTRKIGRAVMYKVNEKHPVVVKLTELEFELSSTSCGSCTFSCCMGL